MKTILVPTDFSKCAKNALNYAYQIAKTTQAKIHLIHVSEIVTKADVLVEYWTEPELENEYIKNVLESVNKALHKEISDEKFKDIQIIPKAELGVLASKIKEIAQNINADLIVMGTEGTSGFEEVAIGSNSEKVVRTAPCPVLVISNEATSFQFKKVVFPTTLQESQLVAFEKLKTFQDIFDFEVSLLYLNNPMQFINDDEARARKEMLCEKSGLKNSTVFIANALNEQGMIYQFAEEKKADVIVMATHQRRGILHFLFGSLTEDIVNHSPLPVLSLSLVNE